MVVLNKKNKHYYTYLMLVRIMVLFIIITMGWKALNTIDILKENSELGTNILYYCMLGGFIYSLLEWIKKSK